MNANELIAATFALLLQISMGLPADPDQPDDPGQAAARIWMEKLQEEQARSEIGEASIMSEPQPMACGAVLNRRTRDELWAAHPSLPCWTRINVTSLKTGKEVTVIVMDRGPYTSGRIIDLTRGAAARIGLTLDMGVMPVRLTWRPLDQQPPAEKRRRRR